MFTEKNFKIALELMNFKKISDGVYQKNFAENISMKADFNRKKLFYPPNLKVHRDGVKNFSQNENFVVFECVHRLLEKNYLPQDIEIEKSWQLGHSQKSGRADICVSHDEKILFIIECKTFGAEFDKALDILKEKGGQLFSYRQQETSCQWLILYASTLSGEEIIFDSKSVSCHEEIYKSAKNVQDFFKIWSEKFNKNLADDVIFHDETVAYQIGVKPFRKKNLKDFPNASIVNDFEEILRHNDDSNKPRAFDALLALFICKIFDESHKNPEQELEFQFKIGIDDEFSFEDRLRKLYKNGMSEFMHKKISDTSDSELDDIFFQFKFAEDEALIHSIKTKFREQKFFTTNHFSFIDIDDEELFYKNSKILHEVVDIFKRYKIIGAKNLQILGDLFEQLLDKGFKQDEGKFFTPLPITRFIWDSLPLEKIISPKSDFVPKIIDYACGAGHFLTQGFEAVNYFTENNLQKGWESEKIFGVEKDDRLAKVSKISFFMHGADKGKIKRGDGLENFPAEGIAPESFDILVSNPPYSIKNFKQHLKIENELDTLGKIEITGSEIETLFVERISQLLKSGGIAAVILPSSILNKDGKSFVSAREKILQNFYVRAIAEFGSKTFSATGTKTNILFLEKISDPPDKFNLLSDTVSRIFSKNFSTKRIDEDIFDAWLVKIKVDKKIYSEFIGREKNYFDWKNDAHFGEYFANFDGKFTPPRTLSDAEKITWLNHKFYDFAHEIEREKILYFAQTFEQTTLIISAPDKNDEQEKFLGYSWSNRKGDEGIKIKNPGGLLYDEKNRRAENKLAFAVRKIFFGEKVQIPDAQNYFNYFQLSDLIDFSGANFTKAIKIVKQNFEIVEYSGNFETIKLEKAAPYVTEKISLDEIKISDYVTTDNMLKDKRGIKIFEGEPQISSVTKFLPKDILISNIRPYLKKIWFANRSGGCSNDVLVFRSFDEKILLPEYLFIVLSQDYFFDFAMSTVKGLKMPRGDKKNILNFEFPLPSVEEQKKIVGEFETLDEKISAQEKIITGGDAKIKNKFAEMFGGFEKNISFAKICIDDTKNGEKIPASEYLPEGKIQIIDQSVNEIAGYSNFEENFYENLPCIIFGDHTEIFKYIDEKFFLGADGTKILIPADRNKIDTIFLFYMLKFEYKIVGGYSRHFRNLSSQKFYLPPKELQEKFAEFVKSVEEEKNSARNLKEKFLIEREALVEKYFR